MYFVKEEIKNVEYTGMFLVTCQNATVARFSNVLEAFEYAIEKNVEIKEQNDFLNKQGFCRMIQ